MVRVPGPKFGKCFGRTRILKAAAGLKIRQDHDLIGAQDLCHLGHETNPAKGDHVRIGGCRPAR